MSVYTKSGVPLDSVYSRNGALLANAYNKNGEIIFPDEIGEVSIKVMTYNPQQFTRLNSQQTMQDAIINGNDPDIIGFQEFSSNGSVPTVGSAVLTAYPVKRLSNHVNYIAMVSKYALSNVVIADYTDQDSEDMSRYGETRAYMIADLTKDRVPFKWVNTHLCYLTQSVKHQQMSELFDIVEQLVAQNNKVIITGDFNSYAASASDADYINMYKPFVDAGYNLVNNTAERGFTKTYSGSSNVTSLADMTYATDNIIVSPDIEIVNVTFDTTKFSYLDGNPIDHIPIIAQLRLN